MPITRGHDASAYFVQETTAGTDPGATAALLRFSKNVRNWNWTKDRNLAPNEDLSEFLVDGHFSTHSTYGASIEFDLFDLQDLEPFFSRSADGSLNTFTLQWEPNANATTPEYYVGTGFHTSSFSLNGAVGQPWRVTLNLIGGVWADPTTTAPTRASQEARSAFGASPFLWRSGLVTTGGTAFGTLLQDFSLEVDFEASENHTSGGADPVAGAYDVGHTRITGTSTFSLDAGGDTHWTRVNSDTPVDIVIPFGSTGADQLTIADARYPGFEGGLAVGDHKLMGNQAFMAETLTVGTVA